MRKKLQKVGYYPHQTGNDFIKDLQLQIIYALLGSSTEVFHVINDPYAFEFEATDKQRIQIQCTINRVLTEIMNHNKGYALYTLFINGLYFGPNPAMIALEKVA